MDDFITLLENTPPSCLQGLACVPTNLPEPWDDNPKSVWQVRCKCGGTTGRLMGYSLADYNDEYDGPLELISPLAFQCASCEHTAELLDTDIHGYHADIDLREGITGGSCKIRGTGQRGSRLAFPCPKCNADIFSIIVGFVFWNGNELEDLFDGRWEDLFNVFLCYAVCLKCDTISRQADFGKL